MVPLSVMWCIGKNVKSFNCHERMVIELKAIMLNNLYPWLIAYTSYKLSILLKLKDFCSWLIPPHYAFNKICAMREKGYAVHKLFVHNDDQRFVHKPFVENIGNRTKQIVTLLMYFQKYITDVTSYSFDVLSGISYHG